MLQLLIEIFCNASGKVRRETAKQNSLYDANSSCIVKLLGFNIIAKKIVETVQR